MGVRQEVVFIPVYFSVSFKVGRLTKGHHAHFTTEAHIGLNTCSATKAHSRLKTCTATVAKKVKQDKQEEEPEFQVPVFYSNFGVGVNIPCSFLNVDPLRKSMT